MWRHLCTEDLLFYQHQVQTAYAVLPALYRVVPIFFPKWIIRTVISQSALAKSETFVYFSKSVILDGDSVFSGSCSQLTLAVAKCIADGRDDTSETADFSS